MLVPLAAREHRRTGETIIRFRYAVREERRSALTTEVGGRRREVAVDTSFCSSHSWTAAGSNRTELPILKFGMRLLAAIL